MVWGPEGTFSERFQRVLLFTGHRTDAGDGQGFLRFQGWEQLRELMGQSALAADGLPVIDNKMHVKWSTDGT